MVKLYYDGDLIYELVTNHSVSIDFLIDYAGIDLNEVDEYGDCAWDYELFTMSNE